MPVAEVSCVDLIGMEDNGVGERILQAKHCTRISNTVEKHQMARLLRLLRVGVLVVQKVSGFFWMLKKYYLLLLILVNLLYFL